MQRSPLNAKLKFICKTAIQLFPSIANRIDIDFSETHACN